MAKAEEKKIEIRRDGIRQIISCLVVFLPIMAGGMISGWTSPVEKYLMNVSNICENCTQPNNTSSDGILNKTEFSWITSVLYFGVMAGCLVWNPITEIFGRKVAGYVVGLLQISAWAGIMYKTDFIILLICRFLLGVSISGGVVVGMSYTNEIASDRLKGPLSSLGALFLNAGFLVIYTLGSIFSYNMINTICIAFPITFLLLFFKLPESPLYLLMDNQEAKAKESFMWFRGNKEHKVRKEMAAIQASPTLQSRVSFKDLFTSRSTTASVIIAMMLFFGQQISGVTVITSYAEKIFERAGSDISPGLSSIVMGLVQLFGCCLPSLLANRVNQKVVLVMSYFLAALSLIVVGGAFTLIEQGYENRMLKTVPLIGMISYIVGFTVGIATVPFTLFMRMFEPKVMSLAMSFGQVAGSVAAFITAKLFFTSIEYFHYSGTFYMLGLACIIMAIYVMKFIDVENAPRIRVCHVVPTEQIEKNRTDLIIN